MKNNFQIWPAIKKVWPPLVYTLTQLTTTVLSYTLSSSPPNKIFQFVYVRLFYYKNYETGLEFTKLIMHIRKIFCNFGP